MIICQSIYPEYSTKVVTYHGQNSCESLDGEKHCLFNYRIYTNVVTDAATRGRQGLVDRVKGFLKVDNDNSEELHNKYRETSKDRDAKIKLFEEQLNIKVLSICDQLLTIRSVVRQRQPEKNLTK